MQAGCEIETDCLRASAQQTQGHRRSQQARDKQQLTHCRRLNFALRTTMHVRKGVEARPSWDSFTMSKTVVALGNAEQSPGSYSWHLSLSCSHQAQPGGPSPWASRSCGRRLKVWKQQSLTTARLFTTTNRLRNFDVLVGDVPSHCCKSPKASVSPRVFSHGHPCFHALTPFMIVTVRQPGNEPTWR